jgi:hypothetical protein
MCNRARLSYEPKTILAHFGADWLTEKPRDNRFAPAELLPKGRAYVVREEGGQRFDQQRASTLQGVIDGCLCHRSHARVASV